MRRHPSYPKLIWVQAIASDTHTNAFTTGYVSPGLTPLVVMRETDESWIGYDAEDRYDLKRPVHWLKSTFRVVEQDIEEHVRA